MPVQQIVQKTWSGDSSACADRRGADSGHPNATDRGQFVKVFRCDADCGLMQITAPQARWFFFFLIPTSLLKGSVKAGFFGQKSKEKKGAPKPPSLPQRRKKEKLEIK